MLKWDSPTYCVSTTMSCEISISLFNRHLLNSYYTLDPVQGTENRIVNKTECLPSWNLDSSRKSKDNT